MNKRTLLVTYDFPPIVSGIGSFFYNTWRFLPSADNFILAPRVKGAEAIDNSGRVKVFRYINWFSSPAIRSLILLFYLPLLLTRERINTLICAVPVSIGVIGLGFKKFFHLPYCVFYYGGEFDKYKRNKIFMGIIKMVVRNASYVITNSGYSSKEVEKFGIDTSKIIKITPGVDTEKFRPGIDCFLLKKRYGLEGKKVLLTVARLVKRKGVEVVIQSLPKILDACPEVIYLIVGTGEEEAYLKRLVKEKGLEEKVIFVGFVSDEELPKYYNLCDIYVMPNIITEGDETLEGFGISFVEASACAKPCIGGLSGGVEEAVEEGKTGFLVNPSNTDILIGRIIWLLNDEKLRRSIGDNGRQKTASDFKWQDRAQKLRDIVDAI